ncbi:hypothetical protein, partial [Nocardia asiatica]|uniref:hypothetical protein n=1 Tax=Nocardia asiatica TaxID=209252 RepID=UPI00245553F3
PRNKEYRGTHSNAPSAPQPRLPSEARPSIRRWGGGGGGGGGGGAGGGRPPPAPGAARPRPARPPARRGAGPPPPPPRAPPRRMLGLASLGRRGCGALGALECVPRYSLFRGGRAQNQKAYAVGPVT